MDYERKELLLSVDHVSLKFGDKLILRDVHAEIHDVVRPDCVTGQVICFLGPSGIGKTQLSRVIAGLQKPTEGTVRIGQALTPVTAGMVGMVPQDYRLFRFATVLENFTIAGRQAGLSRDAAYAKAEPLMLDFELHKYLAYYPHQLSGGTRQRVAIVRQLLCSDHFLVMDEPFSGLDLIMKQRACEAITHVANKDELNTIIIVTHDVSDGMSVADTVWLMGQERNEQGQWLPGARLVEEYDLAAKNLCWRADIYKDPEFLNMVTTVKERFRTLRP